VCAHKRATATVAAADRGGNRWDASLTYTSLPRMTTREVMTVVTPKSKRQDWSLAHCAGRSVGPEPEAAQVSRDRLATARQPSAGSDPEPARLETTEGVPRDLASKPATSRPDEESWDFDGSEQDFGEEKNPPKSHANS
jgi:hypothetical protein